MGDGDVDRNRNRNRQSEATNQNARQPFFLRFKMSFLIFALSSLFTLHLYIDISNIDTKVYEHNHDHEQDQDQYQDLTLLSHA